MKKLSDYKGEEAIELWGELLEPVTNMLSNPKVAESARSGKSILETAKVLLSENAKDVEEVLLTIDDTPLTGLTIPLRLISLLKELNENEELKGFFGSAEQKTASVSSGSATESTEADAT